MIWHSRHLNIDVSLETSHYLQYWVHVLILLPDLLVHSWWYKLGYINEWLNKWTRLIYDLVVHLYNAYTWWRAIQSNM